jgi:hypothetical protein
MTKDVEWGPWIGWNGGERPVDGDAVVEVVTKHGSSDGKASDYCWSFRTIAYRVKKEPVVEVCQQLVVVYDLPMPSIHATCTYTDGKLTKIHWEANNAD